MNPARMPVAPSGPVRQTISQSWAAGDGAEQGEPRPHVRAAADGDLAQGHLVAAGAGARQPGGIDAMGGDQRRRLRREGVRLVLVARRLGLRQQLAHLVEQRIVVDHRSTAARSTAATSGRWSDRRSMSAASITTASATRAPGGTRT